jgi:signal peptidase I
VAPFDGEVCAEKRADDGRVVVYVASGLRRSEEIKVPDDALTHIEKSLSDGTEMLKFLGETGSRAQVLKSVWSVPGSSMLGVYPYHVKKGQKIFAGYDTSGDFVFVNRWKWNFRKPDRGDVMVFSTTGIDGLMQGTHYIKRVTALPNETIEITDGGDVVIDDKVMPPLKPMTGARGEATPRPNPGRCENGFAMNGKVKLGDNEYFTCGDNSDNSLDSRYWGAVPEKKVTGNAACVFWPIINPRWGTIK